MSDIHPHPAPTRKALLCLGMALMLAVSSAQAQPTAPLLRIEAGVHTAQIRHIATDAANHYLVTCSDDKTARVWDLTTGRLLRVLRPPIGDGDEGKLYSVAMSPDGRAVACAGWTGYEWEQSNCIYLFDRATGQVVRRLTGLPGVIFHLAYSPDGGFLAAALFGKNGLRLYRPSEGALIGEDRDYGGTSYGVAFDRSGRLATTGWDGHVRLYENGPNGLRRVDRVKAKGGRRPNSVAFSPDGSRLAVGFDDARAVDVFSAGPKRLKYTFSPDMSGVENGNLVAVAWSTDGRFLYAGGKWQRSGFPIRRWSDGGRGAFTDLACGAYNTILDLAALRDGGIAFGSFDPAFGVLDAEGRQVLLKSPEIADYRNNREGFHVSPDGATVQFSCEAFGKRPVRFSLTTRTLTSDPTPDPPLFAPRTEAFGIQVTKWENTDAPKLNGRPLALDPYEMSRSLSVTPDASGFLLGASWSLRSFSVSGAEQWKVPVPGAVWTVNVAGSGRVALAAFGDGTIRWYRLRDGKELLAFFPHKDGRRWVVWTPSGYYDASPGGEDLIGWHLNQGRDRAADFFPVGRFRAAYYRPDVIDRILETLDEAEALRLAGEASGRKTQ